VKTVELGKKISCSLKLSNKSDDYVAFKVLMLFNLVFFELVNLCLCLFFWANNHVGHARLCQCLWSTHTLQIRHVPVSDTCCVWHQYDTDTYNYPKSCDFLKLL